MPRSPIIQPDQSYTFADYFKLNFAPQDILAHFQVTLQRRSVDLPQYAGKLDRLHDLTSRIAESLPRLSLTSEMARREFLIAPVLMEILHYTPAMLNVEYPVAVNPQLKGVLDYLLQNDQTFLVIKAKNEDLERGFVQLAVELIALDQWIESDRVASPAANGIRFSPVNSAGLVRANCYGAVLTIPEILDVSILDYERFHSQ
jgi:hypothetical protein